MGIRFSLLTVAASAVVSISALPTNADTATVTFETEFSVSDAIEGSASGLSGTENLPISFDSQRGLFDDTVFLPRFDSDLGQLTSVNLAIEFERSVVTLPITITDATGAGRTASVDELSIQRGFVFGVATGFDRPLVIQSATETVDLDVLEPNGLLTVQSPTSAQLDIPTTGPGSFAPSDGINSFPTLSEGQAAFSFTGEDNFGFVFRRVAEISVGLDQDDFNLTIDEGAIEYAGTVSVTYEFTAVPEPSGLVLLGLGGLVLMTVRCRMS